MKITNDSVVLFEYQLYGSDGEFLDSTAAGASAAYLHGHDNIVPGLEEALTDKIEGDYVEVTVPPEKGYGEHQPELVQTAPLSAFPEGDPPRPGMRFEAKTDAGSTAFLVTAVEDSEVTIDANPMLAGRTLRFEITILGVREATAAEIEQGHL